MSIDIDRYLLARELGELYNSIQISQPTMRRNDWVYDLYNLTSSLAEVSELPTPAGHEKKVSNTGTYYDETYMHVWYGSRVAAGGVTDEDVFYTKAASPFTAWDAAVEVISAPGAEGCRDCNCVQTKDTLYITTQNTDGVNFKDPRLYKIGKTDDFTASGDYTLIGTLLALGAGGTYDDKMVASPALQLIDGLPVLAYEALKNATNVYSIGLAYSDDIETVPYTRIGQATDFAAAAIANPHDPTDYIVPTQWLSRGCLGVHLLDAGGKIDQGFMVGDPLANNWALVSELNPTGYDNFFCMEPVGVIDDYFYAFVGARDAAQTNPKLWRVAV